MTYKENKDLNKYHHDWRKKNPKSRKKTNAKYREKNKEEINRKAREKYNQKWTNK